MFYAVIRRFDILSEIETSMLAEAHKLSILGFLIFHEETLYLMLMQDFRNASLNRFITIYIM